MSLTDRYSPTCTELGDGGGGATATDGVAGKGFMLFGVRVMEGAAAGSFRKCASMTNLAQFDHHPQESNADVNAGYTSDDVVHPSAGSRERKRGVAWTEEEHRLFLLGLQKVGKGDWRGISRNFVKSRTPTQVASHAQKYFLRRNNHGRRRRRSSLFDITTDNVLGAAKLEQQSSTVEKLPVAAFPMTAKPVLPPPVIAGDSSHNYPTKPTRPIPVLPAPPSSKLADLNLNRITSIAEPLPLSLKLPTPPSPQPPSSSSSEQKSPPGRHTPAFQAMSGSFNSNNGDSIISVA
ncbi:PREDICTED: transcription factor MYB1R1 [Ipomoea nil]|uniref:transcription factor MYB1R1 n=1 Tax=Ipomoea nil TaxID=35883 RepID=UPI000901C8D0|nr:PREDICTED: transcription factor MYB1R1 [Ipomoea nil]